MDRTLRFIAERSVVVLAVLGAITALALGQLIDFRTGELRLELDASFDRILPREGPEWEVYDELRTAFGTDEQVVVALHVDQVFTSEVLERVHRITERIEEIDGVYRVVSLTSARHSVASDGGFPVPTYIVEEIPTPPEDVERIREIVAGNPLYAGILVSEDERTTAIVVQFLDFGDREYIDRGLSGLIETIVREEAGPAEFWIAGGLHLKAAQYDYQLADLTRTTPIVLIVLGVVLALAFRNLRGVVLPLLTVVVALIWTLGLAAWIGRPLNLVTVLIPPLLLILGVSYSVHVVTEYGEMLGHEPGATRREAVAKALGRIWVPVVLTGATTAIGFLAMLLQEVEAVREFGLLSLLGVLLTVLASLTLPPALLALLGGGGTSQAKTSSKDAIERLAEVSATFSRDHRRWVLTATALVFAAAVASASQLRVGTNSIEAFPEDSRVRSDFNAINAELQGVSTLNIALKSARKAFREPDSLRTIVALQDWLEAQPEVGGTTSVVDYLDVCNRALNDTAGVPETSEQVGELLFWCGNEMRGYITNKADYTNVAVRTHAWDTEDVNALVDRIEVRLDELPEHLQAAVTGNPILMTDLIDRIVRGQVLSVLGALVLIYFVLLGIFPNPFTAGVALVPNILPIAAYFAALSVTGVSLNPTTSVIAPMALGIAIDDTIHYLIRFQSEGHRLADEQEAVKTALQSVGRPVTYTTIAICAGFLVFTTSDMRDQVQLGLLGAFTLGMAWVAEFTVTPAISAGVRVVTLWDTLTLDLGGRPQQSVPAIFKGLSIRQCRILALMAGIREHPAGSRIWTEGDPGRDMYAILDGTVRIWQMQNGQPHELAVAGRGELLGEIGLFTDAGLRTATIDALDDVRLLSFSEPDTRRLSRRYPRIGYQLLHNLNAFQAERLARREMEDAAASETSDPAAGSPSM